VLSDMMMPSGALSDLCQGHAESRGRPWQSITGLYEAVGLCGPISCLRYILLK